MYLFYGDEKFLIQKQIRQITNKSNLEVLIFNEESSIEELFYSITTISLNGQKNNIIINNIDLIIENNSVKQINNLFEIVKNNKDINQLFFTIISSKVNKKNNLLNYLLEAAQVYEYKKNNNLASIIKTIVKQNQGNISEECISILLEQLPQDLGIISNHVQKLLMYDKSINLENIEKLKNPIEKENIYGFINAFNNWEIKNIWFEYKKFIKNDGDVMFLISMISNQLDLAFKLWKWKSENNQNNILLFSNEQKIQFFRVKQMNTFINKLGWEKLKKLISDLALLDLKIKRGQAEKNLCFESFLIKNT